MHIILPFSSSIITFWEMLALLLRPGGLLEKGREERGKIKISKIRKGLSSSAFPVSTFIHIYYLSLSPRIRTRRESVFFFSCSVFSIHKTRCAALHIHCDSCTSVSQTSLCPCRTHSVAVSSNQSCSCDCGGWIARRREKPGAPCYNKKKPSVGYRERERERERERLPDR